MVLSRTKRREARIDDGTRGIGRGVVKYRRFILILAILLLIPSIIGYKATKINYDMLTYLPKEIETVKGQDLLLDDFGKGAFAILVTENMKTDAIEQVSSDIKQVKHVDTVLNLNKVINPSIPVSMYPDIVRKNINNPDASMVVIFFDASTSDERTMNAVTNIRKVVTKDCYLSGMSSMVVDLKNLCEDEELKYVAIAVVLSLIAMMLLLDSFAAPVFFLLSIGMAILYNLGSNIFLGEIAFITKAIAAVLQLAVTMDYSIFLWHSYVEQRDHGLDRNEAMTRAVNATLVSVAGSSLTTIAGFLAMCFMSYTMGMNLGIVMAKGVLLGVVCSVTVLPSLLLAFAPLVEKTRHRALIPNMSRFAHRLTSKYGIFIAIFILALIPAVIGYQHENITYDFTKMMSSNADALPAKYTQYNTAGEKLQNDFDIATTYMVLADADMPAKDGRAMCDRIEDLDGIKTVLGMDSIVGPAIPRDALPEEITGSLEAGGHQLIMINSAYKVSTSECNHQINMVNKIVHQYDKKATVIGEAPATKDLISITNNDFKMVTFVSILAVFLIILFTLRSISLPIILVCSIEFAIYLNLGISGFTGLELPFLVPILISTIQLGSTVDYAILMSTRYKTERATNKPKREAIEIAATNTIPSIITSALGFFTATFGVAIYSDIGIISTLCMLMARGAIISMLTVILVLPSLLMAFDRPVCATTLGLRKKDRAAYEAALEEQKLQQIGK
ncbi:MAG: MMPL family transporter [Eubacteriales bacterium]|nr:MMPL family transporter [Eubacteriales bacterium]